MADNVDIKDATSTTVAIATDQVQVGGTQGLGQVQFVKLVDGTLNGTDALPGTAANGLDVDVTRVSGNVSVIGEVAHDAADSGNPQKMGAKAETSLAGITVVADGDRTDLYADADGVLMMKPFVPFGDIKSERVADTGGTSTAFTNFSAVANTRNFLTTIAVYNTSATAGYVDIRDGTGGSVLFTVPAPAGGGSIIPFPVPLRQPTANTALAYDVSGALTTVYISAVGFQSKA